MPPVNTTRTLAAALLLFANAPFLAHACSCVTLNAPCDKGWNSGDLVFAGTVVSKAGGEQLPSGDGTFTLSDYQFHFASTDVFRGIPKIGQEIVVSTGFGGGDCGYPFVVGQRYLVYAYNFKGQLTASTCSETAPEVMVSGTVRELRMLRDRERADDLFGNIGTAPRGPGFEDLVESEPLAGIPVHATGKRGARFSTTTDEQGVYSFASLPSDAYRVEEDLPAGFSRPDERETRAFTVHVVHKSRTGALCRVSAFPNPDGEISGKVVDSDGKGVPGFITLQPFDPAEAQWASTHVGSPGEETDDGTFSLPQLPPGKYRLVFHPAHGGEIFYWPGGRNTPSPDAIELKFGQHLDKVRFEISPPRPAR